VVFVCSSGALTTPVVHVFGPRHQTQDSLLAISCIPGDQDPPSIFSCPHCDDRCCRQLRPNDVALIVERIHAMSAVHRELFLPASLRAFGLCRYGRRGGGPGPLDGGGAGFLEAGQYRRDPTAKTGARYRSGNGLLDRPFWYALPRPWSRWSRMRRMPKP